MFTLRISAQSTVVDILDDDNNVIGSGELQINWDPRVTRESGAIINMPVQLVVKI